MGLEGVLDMVAVLGQILAIHQDAAAFPAVAKRQGLGLIGGDEGPDALIVPVHMVQLGEGIQPDAFDGAVHQVVGHRRQEFHRAGLAEDAHLHQERRDGARQIREHAPIGEVAGLQRAADEAVVEQLAQVLLGFFHILQADGREGTVDDAMGGVVLLGALAVGDDDGFRQRGILFGRDRAAGPYVIMVGHVAVVVVLLDRRPGPFLEAAVQVQEIGRKGCELGLPVGDVLLLDAQGLAAIDQVHQDLAADGDVHDGVDPRGIDVSAGDRLIAGIRGRVLRREGRIEDDLAVRAPVARVILVEQGHFLVGRNQAGPQEFLVSRDEVVAPQLVVDPTQAARPGVMRIGAGEMIVQAGIRVAVDAGQQAAGAVEQLRVGAEVIELRLVILEIRVHLVEEARVVSRADLQVRVDVVLARQRRILARLVDLEEAAHVIELLQQGGIQLVLAVGATEQFLAGKQHVLVGAQMDPGTVHPLADVLFVPLEQLVEIDLHGQQSVTDGLGAFKGEVAFEPLDLRDDHQAVRAGNAHAFFGLFHGAALGQEADDHGEALVAEVRIVRAGQRDHALLDSQLMGAVSQSGQPHLHVQVQLSLRCSEAVHGDVPVIGAEAFVPERTARIRPHGGDHAVLHVQEAQIVPGIGLLRPAEGEREGCVPPRPADGVQNPVVEIHVLFEAGLFLGLVHQGVRLIRLALQQQLADAGQVGAHVWRQGSLRPFRLKEQLLGIGHHIVIGLAGSLDAQGTVAGDEIVRRIFRGGDGADSVLRQDGGALLHRNIGDGILELFGIYLRITPFGVVHLLGAGGPHR